MSYIERTRDWTKQERLELVRTYKNIIDTPINSWFPEFTIESGRGKYDMVAKMVDSKKKCCDSCAYFYGDCCDMEVSNVYAENLIKDSGTFYCSYHKFKV